jgi:hypothetical protein
MASVLPPAGAPTRIRIGGKVCAWQASAIKNIAGHARKQAIVAIFSSENDMFSIKNRLQTPK